MKKLIKGLVALVVLLVVLLFVAGYFIDDIAKEAIQTGGSKALGVNTAVDEVRIGILRGTASLKGLSVDNPQGFGDGTFLNLGEGSIEVNARSLMSDLIRVPSFTLKDIAVDLISTSKGSNYGAILDNLEKYDGESEAQQSEGQEKRFIIDKLLIENVKVRVEPSKDLGLGEVTIPIDKIELKDVGSESDKGVLLSDVAAIVVESILQKASASGQLPNLIKGALDGKLKNLTTLQDAGLEALDEALGGTKLPDDAGKALDDVRKGLGNKLKGLGR